MPPFFSFLEEQVVADDDSEFQYEEVPTEDEFYAEGSEEDLERAVRTINEAAQDALAQVE